MRRTDRRLYVSSHSLTYIINSNLVYTNCPVCTGEGKMSAAVVSTAHSTFRSFVRLPLLDISDECVLSMFN